MPQPVQLSFSGEFLIDSIEFREQQLRLLAELQKESDIITTEISAHMGESVGVSPPDVSIRFVEGTIHWFGSVQWIQDSWQVVQIMANIGGAAGLVQIVRRTIDRVLRRRFNRAFGPQYFAFYPGTRVVILSSGNMENATAWENWRFQVDSGWNRSNYFAILETVAIAGAWQVLEHGQHPKTALFFAFLGFVSTLIWFLNDLINHAYILYWWKSTEGSKEYEDRAEWLVGRWWPKVGLKYSHLMHLIPIIFAAAWLWILALFIPSPRCGYVAAMVGGLAFIWIVLVFSKTISDRSR
jgi:hypothetical protein